MNDQTLLAEMKALMEVRRREDPLVQAMSADVKQIRQEIRGLSQCVHLALGNSRDAVEQVKVLEATIAAHAGTITELQNELTDVREQLAIAIKRIEAMAEWAKTQQGKK